MKKTFLMFAAFAVLFCAGQAHATTAAKTASPQQNRMKTCAAQYHEKKIAKSEYRKFMSQCLRTHPIAAKADPAKK